MKKTTLRKILSGLAALSCALCLASCVEKMNDETEEAVKVTESVTEKAEETEPAVTEKEEGGLVKSEVLMGMTPVEILESFEEDTLNGVITVENGTEGMPDSAVKTLDSLIDEFNNGSGHLKVIGNAANDEIVLVYMFDEDCYFDCISLFNLSDGSLVDTNLCIFYKKSVISAINDRTVTEGLNDFAGFGMEIPVKWHSLSSERFHCIRLIMPEVNSLGDASKSKAVESLQKLCGFIAEADTHGIFTEVQIVKGYETAGNNVINAEASGDTELPVYFPDLDYNEAKQNDSEVSGNTPDKSIVDLKSAVSGVFDSGSGTESNSVSDSSGYTRSGAPGSGYLDLPAGFTPFESTDYESTSIIYSMDSSNPLNSLSIQTVNDGTTDAKGFAAESAEGVKAMLSMVGFEPNYTSSEISFCQGRYNGIRYDVGVPGVMTDIICAFSDDNGIIHLIQVGSAGDNSFDPERVIESYSLTE